MKLSIYQLFLVIILLTTFSDSFSQSSYNIHIGPSIPLSDYGVYTIHAREGDITASGALGVDIGFQYSYQWSEKGFGIFSSLDFILGDVSQDWKDKANEISEVHDFPLITLPVYLYFPLSAGLFYKYEASKSFSLYCNSGPTFNCMKVTDNEWETAVWETDWSTSLGFRIGVGLLIKERLSFCVDYLGLGKHYADGRLVKEVYPEEYNHVLNVHLLTLTTGWNF